VGNVARMRREFLTSDMDHECEQLVKVEKIPSAVAGNSGSGGSIKGGTGR
jgi:hypothetical protein